jgi:hypothetical protein
MDITKEKGQREEGGMDGNRARAFYPPFPRVLYFFPAVKKSALKIFTLKFPNPSFSNFFPRIEEKQK